MTDEQMLSAFPIVSGRPFDRKVLGGPYRREDHAERERNLLAVIELDNNEFGDHINYIGNDDGRGKRDVEGQFPINHFPTWVDKTASVYASAPFRTFRYQEQDQDPESEIVKQIETLYRDASADAMLAMANRFTDRTGNCIGVVGWSDRRNGPVIRLWHGGEMRVQTEDGDPQSPTWIVLRRDDKTVYSWKYEGDRYTLDGTAQVLPDPFLHFFRTTPNASYMVPGTGVAMGGIAVMLMSYGYNALGEMIVYQAFSVWNYFGNPPSGQNSVKIGPRTVFQFQAKGEQGIEGMETVTPDARFTEVLDAIDQLKKAAQESFQIPATLWDASDDASGAQTEESRAPLLEYRKARSKSFVLPETMLLRKMLALAVHNGRIPKELVGDIDSWDVEVAFVDPLTERVMEDQEDTADGRNPDGTGDGPDNGSDSDGGTGQTDRPGQTGGSDESTDEGSDESE